jgi:hypothetical protein
MSWDLELQQKSRRILLVLGSCAAHPRIDSLKNMQLEFLSPQTTSRVQPVDMGIMTNLRTLYFAKLVNFILEAIQENSLMSSSTAKEVSVRIDLLQEVPFIASSW